EVRYALILSSVYSRAVKLPPVLLAACLKYGAIDWKRASSSAALYVEPEQRARAWATIAPAAPPDARENALKTAVEAALSINEDRVKFEIFTVLASVPDLPEDLIDEILMTCLHTKNVLCGDILMSLAPRLKASVLKKAIRIANGIDWPLRRVQALSAL